MALTYLDSLMIENPAMFVSLSVQSLSADLANINKLIADSAKINKLIIPPGPDNSIYTQHLTADNAFIGNLENKVANTLYVSVSGSDSNTGVNIFAPLRTIRKACQIAHNSNLSNSSGGQKYTIMIGTGDYTEQNPVIVPPNASIIGDNLRRATIRPANPTKDILWVNNSTYVWGVTFRGHLSPAAAVAFPNYDGADGAAAKVGYTTPTSTGGWIKPAITTSPYIQGSSSITSTGAGMRIDGSLVQGYLRSMVLDSYTQLNEGGKGIHILNNGYAQLVSIFTICCTEGIKCESGGSCSINTSNCSFGLSGLVATGKSPSPVLSGTIVTNPLNTKILTIQNVNGINIYPGLTFPTIASVPYNGMVFKIDGDTTYYPVDGNPTSTGGVFTVGSVNSIRYSAGTGTKVNFYIRSTITSSAHTFEYIGSGTTLADAIPARGGVSKPADEVVSDDDGAVYFTSTNQSGNFSVGNEFSILQETGTIEGDTFKRSIIALVTPLVLSLE